ncbi:MAG: tRNA pseudouridine(55) synthase TruB [Steroidobacteraceae bacterium]|nr:tRNA pseudouridine(55) synthase TruB [Steroidobacteraceae bacterium]
MSGPDAPARRQVDGILLLDKPEGLSSNAALQRVRRAYRALKAGHTGSLDPLASGLLPVCLGQATKASGLLLDADKTYDVTIALGERTATGDREGETVERAEVPALDPAAVRRVAAGFQGERTQVPPMYSALKHAGERLYRLARKGVEVERTPRPIVIHRLDLLELAGATLRFEARCSKGTYVRTLAEDIARALGTVGHVTRLRRLSLGPFASPRMHGLGEVEQAAGDFATLDALLLAPDAALEALPAVRLGVAEQACFLQGQPVFAAGPPGAKVRVYASEGRFLGVGQMTPEGRRLAPDRIMIDLAAAGRATA